MNMLFHLFIYLILGYVAFLGFSVLSLIIWRNRAWKRLRAARKEYDVIEQKYGSRSAASHYCPHKVVTYYKMYYPSGLDAGYYPRCKFCDYHLEWCLHPLDDKVKEESLRQRAKHGLYSLTIEGNLTLIQV